MEQVEELEANPQPPPSSTPGTRSTRSPFIGDTGPGFDPDRQPAAIVADPLAGAVVVDVEVVSEEKMRSLLKNGGDLAHATVGVGQLDWVMTSTDQDRIAPPLTRIVNTHERLAGVFARSDHIAVVIGSGLYTWRSLIERETVLRAEKRARAAGATPPPPSPAEMGEEPAGTTPAGSFNGIAVPDGYIPEAQRRFGRGGADGR